MGKFKGLLKDIIILFMLGTIVIGLITFAAQEVLTDSTVQKRTEMNATGMANEMIEAIREYPAYRWMIRYWRDHPDDMDIEYDVRYTKGTDTYKKAKELEKRFPDLELKYATAPEIEALPAEDQKLYAEVTYSWLITRMDEMMQSNDISFLFCVLTDENYDYQYFLLSGSNNDKPRGTQYGQYYPLGVVSEVSETQQEGMRQARKNNKRLSYAGDYLDYYVYAETIDDEELLIGMTYDLSELNKAVSIQTWEETGLAMLLEILLACICLTCIHRFVLRPVKGIQENIRLYKNTKNSREVNRNLEQIRPPNEIGALSEDVSEMTEEIDEHLKLIKEITGEQERIKAELTLAEKIQTAMLPQNVPEVTKRPEVNISASMEPAREIGGDFYNYFMIDEDHLCCLIADVSGKGIPAAMFMTAAQSVFQDNARNDKSPARIMEDVNQLFVTSGKSDMFVTIWLGILQLSTGRMIAANAGHEYPAISRQGGPFELYKDAHSFIVGGMENMKYKEYELQFEAGDRIFVYTDGVTEATDDENNMFGTERMIEALQVPGDTPEEDLQHVRSAVEVFTEGVEQFDDLTMLCLEYRGAKE